MLLTSVLLFLLLSGTQPTSSHDNYNKELSKHIVSKQILNQIEAFISEMKVNLRSSVSFESTMKDLIKLSTEIDEKFHDSDELILDTFKITLKLTSSLYIKTDIVKTLTRVIRTLQKYEITKMFLRNLAVVATEQPQTGLLVRSILAEVTHKHPAEEAIKFITSLTSLTRILVLNLNAITIKRILTEITYFSENCLILSNLITELLSQIVKCPTIYTGNIIVNFLNTSKQLIREKLDDILVQLLESLIKKSSELQDCKCMYGFEEFVRFFELIVRQHCENLILDFSNTIERLT